MPSYRDQIQHDERGRPYVLNQHGERVYIAQANDPAAKNTFWSKATWNPRTGNYDRGVSKTSLASLGTLAAIGGPAAYAALGGGSAAGGAGSLANAGAVGSAPAYVPESMIGMGLGGAGTGAVSAADYLGNKPSLGRRILNSVTGGGGGGEGGASPWVKAALAALSGVPALIAAQKNKPTAEEMAMQQQIQDMLASQQRRTTFQDPLHEAVTRLAMSRLPTESQRPLAERM